MNKSIISQHKYIIPSLITYLNLLCGTLAVIFALNNDFRTSMILIILSAIFDFLDGRSARYLNAITEIGKELDSLADVISFGMSPVIIVLIRFNLTSISLIIACLVFLFSGALRLARYNISEVTPYFNGIPITIAGVVLVFTIILNQTAAIIAALVLAYLMNETKIKIKKR